MAINFLQTQVVSLKDIDTVVFESPEFKTTIVFSGVITNKKANGTFKYETYVNLKKVVDGKTTVILDNTPIIYGTSLLIPKIVLPPFGKLIARTDSYSAGNIDITLEMLETFKLVNTK